METNVAKTILQCTFTTFTCWSASNKVIFFMRFRLEWAYEDSKCSVFGRGGVLLFSYAEGLREQPGIAWKGETAAFIHKACDMNSGGLFSWCLVACLLHLRAWSGWGVWGSLEKSLMSERIISVYESSSDFPQIPFHSGEKKKKRRSSAQEEKKTFNASWQARHPVWS